MQSSRGKIMEAEIREQATRLAAVAPGYYDGLTSSLADAKPELILLVARGSSDHAALYARYLIEVHLEIPGVLAAPSVWTRFGRRPRYPHSLAIGISQSGAAPDVAEVLSAMRKAGHLTLAITNTAESRITEAAEHTLLLDLNEEQSIAATKTYSASAVALYQLVRALGASLPPPILPDNDWLEIAERAAVEQLGPILRCTPLFALGRGYDFATAHETALKLMECALLPCKAYSTADFEHGPKALAGAGSALVSFGPAETIYEAQCLRPPAAIAMPEQRPWWDIVFSQFLALHAARARGLDPDQVPNLRKVTETT